RAEDSFLPRLAYGDYLYSRLQSAAQVSLAGFNQVQQEAVAVDREAGAFRVTLADGSDFVTDRVVLAVGTLPPQRLQGVGPRLLVDYVPGACCARAAAKARWKCWSASADTCMHWPSATTC